MVNLRGDRTSPLIAKSASQVDANADGGGDEMGEEVSTSAIAPAKRMRQGQWAASENLLLAKACSLAASRFS